MLREILLASSSENAHKNARKMLKTNREKTKAATEARKKKTVTPGKSKGNTGDRDDNRDDHRDDERNVAENRTEEEGSKKVEGDPSITNSSHINKHSGILKNVDKVNSGEKNGPPLKSATYDKARKVAPGYDIYFIEESWRSSGFAAKAKKPDTAFLGFVKKHVKKNPL